MRRRIILFVDCVLVFLAAVTVALWLTGGFHVRPFGLRISAHGPGRAFFVGAAIAFVRWLWTRDVPFLLKPAGAYARLWARVFDRTADDATARPAARRWWHWLAAAGGLAGMGAVLLQNQLRHMSGVPDLGDPLFSIWRMSWIFRQMGGDPRPFFDSNIYYPTPLTLTLSDSMILPAVSASPMLAAGVAPVVAYNILLLSGFLLSGLAMYLLAVRLTGSVRAAFVAAALYTFYPYRFEHYPHLELQMTQWMPLALLFFHRFVEGRRVKDAVIGALFAVAQLYSSMYYGVFFAFYAAAVVGTLLVLSRAPWRRVVVAAGAAAAVAMVLAAPLARPYMAAQTIKGVREGFVVQFYSAEPLDYLRPHDRIATYAGRLLPPVHPERALFPGLTPIAFSALALVPPLGPLRLAYAAGLVVAADLTSGMNGVWYPWLYEYFPPVRGMRVPARFSIILAISLVVLAAFGVRRLLDRVRSPAARSVLFAALLAVVMIDLRPKLDLVTLWPAPPPIYETLKGRTDVVLAEFPIAQKDLAGTNEVVYSYFSHWHGLPMVNGYSGFEPADHEKLMAAVAEFPDAASIDALRARGVTHVTINCALLNRPCEPVLAAADRIAALRLVTDAAWEGRPVRLYELSR